MVLENFRDYRFVLNNADNHFGSTLYLKQGEKAGRSLSVQLVNRGHVVSTEGITVHLNWKSERTGEVRRGEFEAVDLSEGFYRFVFPEEMTAFTGLLLGEIEVAESGRVVNTRNFKIYVERSVRQ